MAGAGVVEADAVEVEAVGATERPVLRASRSSRPWAEVHLSGHRRRRSRQTSRPVLHVSDLTVRATDGTTILDEVSFSVHRGTVVAVVGPTGAGKTTLLNALTGRLRVQGGAIRVNGEDLSHNETLRRRLGYVPQDDVLHPQLTLRQTLEHAAALRLGLNVPVEERRQRVATVVSELGLDGREHLPVSSLSGGQRKRASVAVELLSRPEVLVLDEPTTGLDPGREQAVLQSLRKLADLGHTVLTVTHSPQALAECDRVLFLAPGGRVAFFGTPVAAIDYFGHSNAADVFLDLSSTPSESWKERFRAHPLHARAVRSADAPNLRSVDDDDRPDASAGGQEVAPPRGRAQFRTLLRRCLDVMRADRRHVVLLAVQGPILGALLCSTLITDSFRPLVGHVSAALSSQHSLDQVSAALFVALSITWLGTANAVREIVKEQRTLLREEGTGLSLHAYVSAKVVALGSVAMAQSAVLAVVAPARQGVPAHGAVLPWGMVEIALVGALAGLSAVAIGLMLSALVTTPDKALTVLPISLVSQLVFSGAWVALDGPVFRQLRDLSSAHWVVHAIKSTALHDARGWWLSVAVLALLTATAVVATLGLVQRRVLPTQIGEAKAKLGFRMTAGLRPAVIALGGVALVLAVTTAAGDTSDFVPRAKLLGALSRTSTPAAPTTPAAPADTNQVVQLATVVAPAPAGTPAIPAEFAGTGTRTVGPAWISGPVTPNAAPAATSAPAATPPAAPAAAPAPVAPAPTSTATTAPVSTSSTSDAEAARRAAWQAWLEQQMREEAARRESSSPSTTSTTTPRRRR